MQTSITKPPHPLQQAELPSNLTKERNTIVDRVRRMGLSASDAILDPHCSIFTLPGIDGMIGYHFEPTCAVVYGDPVCHDNDREQLVSAFHDLCKNKGMNIIYVSASEKFSRWAINHHCEALIEFGEEMTIDPHDDPKAHSGVKGSLVRRKVKHALKEGATVQEYSSPDEEIEKALEAVGKHWLSKRRGPQVHTSHIHIFDNRLGKRWFYLSHKGAIVGLVVLHRMDARQGWLLNHLMHTQEAPHGSPELLITSVLETLAAEGSHFVTFGPVTAERLGEIKGFGSFAKSVARTIFWCANRLFHLDKRRKFWEKFHPKSEKTYLLFASSRFGLKELDGLKKALNVSLDG
ncbi:MAG: DUF2156 domain-containing protein [Parachlamydiaceae bacterium]